MITKTTYPFINPALPYAYDALEPYIDKATMEFHHDKHLQAYVNNLNAALEKYPETQTMTLIELLSNLDKLPQDIQGAVRNNGGGVYNHDMFFELMSANHKQAIPSVIADAFGGVEAFKAQFKAAAMGRFGSGFAWLVKTSDGQLKIISLPNQDTPLAEGMTPICNLDVWEHAYYLKYQNLRANYIDNWFEVANWGEILKRI